MARPKKSSEVAETVAPKRRGRPPKQAPPATAAEKLVTAVKKPAEEPEVARKRGRPPKQQEAAPKKAVEKKPGLVSMTPATAAKPDRKKTLFHGLSIDTEEPRGRGRPAKKVMPVQHEQIIAEELNSKVMNDKSPAKTAKAAGRPPKTPVQAAEPPVKSGRTGKVRQAVSLPPATIHARTRRKVRCLSTVVVILVACAVGGYFYRNHHVEAAEPADTKLIQEVAERVVLPPNETPSISTVVDASQVNQPFLEGAKNGDKVLLFFQSGRAIVFRPSTGQVVNMGTLSQPEPRVFIRKGAANADVTKISSEITGSGDFTVASQDVSPLGNYGKTIVVDVAGNRPDIAAKLAAVLHATVSKLPSGETPPDADLLVIVGSDNATK